MAVPSPRLYPGSNRQAPTLALLGVAAIALSMLFVAYGGAMAEAATHRGWSRTLIVLWGLLPPTWFMVEHFYYFPRHGDSAATFELLRGRQSVLSKAWLAIVVTLAALYWQQFMGAAA